MLIATALTFLMTTDGKPSNAVVDGHKLRVEKTSTSGPFDQQGRKVKHLAITFAVEPKDAAKSFAYEIGQRFVARDAEGKEIPLGRAQSFGFREPAFRLAGYPPANSDDQTFRFRDPLSITLPLFNVDATKIAMLEGDLFVSDVELQEFTFAGNDLAPNTVKKAGAAEAKLFLFDETGRGADVGFKLKLPPRSRPEALTGRSGGFGAEHFLLFATEAGRKSRVSTNSSRSGRGSGEDGDARVRSEIEFQRVKIGGTPDALHLVIPHVETPRRHVFQLKDVAIPPPPPMRKGAPGGPVPPKLG